MLKQERAILIAKELQRLFPETPIPLAHRSAYQLLIAVLLSAQCTDERVNKQTPALFAVAPDAQSMANLSVEEINSYVRPCGLAPTKAKNIHKLSLILLEKYAGNVPESLTELEALPGVGHKTASVVMAQWFGHAAFPVDTHIHRLAQKWKLTSGRSVVETERDLKKLFPEELWNKLHLQIIFFGREICPARQCDGIKCGLCGVMFPKRKTAVIARK